MRALNRSHFLYKSTATRTCTNIKPTNSNDIKAQKIPMLSPNCDGMYAKTLDVFLFFTIIKL